MLVVHVDNPGKFFVRYKREVSQFDRMMSQLNAHQHDRVKMRAKEISIGEWSCMTLSVCLSVCVCVCV